MRDVQGLKGKICFSVVSGETLFLKESLTTTVSISVVLKFALSQRFAYCLYYLRLKQCKEISKFI